MDLYIITGTTQGLGHSLAKIALEHGHVVLSISRSKTLTHDNFFNIKHDLTKTSGLEKKLTTALKKLNLKKISAVHLINNAAVVGPIGSISGHTIESIHSHMQINLIAPVFLTGLVMDYFKKKKIPKTFTNITSGAATKPISGWSLYCTSKAGLKMFTDCLSNEMKDQSECKFLDFSPGVMDTGMQATIRKQSSKNFERVQEFKEMKEKNLLLSPALVASTLYGLLKDPSAINKTHYDVKEFI